AGGQLVGVGGEARRNEAGRKSTWTGKHDVGINRQRWRRLEAPWGSGLASRASACDLRDDQRRASIAMARRPARQRASSLTRDFLSALVTDWPIARRAGGVPRHAHKRPARSRP